MPRPPEAMPENLTNRLLYCGQCKPPLVFGWGGLPTIPEHFDKKSNTTHKCSAVEMAADERVQPGETVADFLARMLKKYVK